MILEFEQFKIDIEQRRQELLDLEHALNLDSEQAELKELTLLTSDPDFWSDPDQARITKRISVITSKSAEYHRLLNALDDLAVLCELGAEEGDRR